MTMTLTSVGEDMEKLEPSRTGGGTAKWCGHFGNEFGSFF